MDAKTPMTTKTTLLVDLRFLSAALALIIVGMLIVWKPWSAPSADNQTVQVTGESTVIDRPDEFVFYPTYEFTGTDKATMLAAVSAKSDEVVAGLKKLGVADKAIKTNTNGYDFPVLAPADSAELTYNLQITITLDNDKIVQKVQDYLVGTTPTGSVSPQAAFSDAKRKQLESKARDAATKDARKKADQSAKNLGFRVGKVKTVTDSAGFGAVPFAAREGVAMAMDVAKSSAQLTVQPGENELHYSVTVTYFIR